MLICSERLAQEDEFNGGHMTLEDGLEVFRRADPTWFQRWQKPVENGRLEWENPWKIMFFVWENHGFCLLYGKTMDMSIMFSG